MERLPRDVRDAMAPEPPPDPATGEPPRPPDPEEEPPEPPEPVPLPVEPQAANQSAAIPKTIDRAARDQSYGSSSLIPSVCWREEAAAMIRRVLRASHEAIWRILRGARI